MNLKFGFDKAGWLTSPARTSAEGGCGFEDGAALCFPLFSPPTPRRGAEERILPARRAPWFVQWGGSGVRGISRIWAVRWNHGSPPSSAKPAFMEHLLHTGHCATEAHALLPPPYPNHPVGKKPFHPHSPHEEPKIQTSPVPSPKLPRPVSSRGRIWTQDTSALNQDGPAELSCTPPEMLGAGNGERPRSLTCSDKPPSKWGRPGCLVLRGLGEALCLAPHLVPRWRLLWPSRRPADWGAGRIRVAQAVCSAVLGSPANCPLDCPGLRSTRTGLATALLALEEQGG